MSPLAHPTFRCFSDYLDRRIVEGQVLSEDTLRYTFFASLLSATDVPQHEILLEVPHPFFLGKKIDTHIKPSERHSAGYVEFKYHRESASTSPKPQKAGDLFNDFCRLAPLISEKSVCMVVYITDAEMATYFLKHSEMYSGFWTHAVGHGFAFGREFLAKPPKTVRNRCPNSEEFYVNVSFSAKLSRGHHLRAYQLSRANYGKGEF